MTRHPSSAATRTAAVLLLVAGLGTGIVGPAWAAGRPDLVVSRVSAPGQVEHGEQLTVTAKVRNARGRRARVTRTRFYLSTDKRAGRTDEVLASVRTKALRRGRAVRVRGRGVPDVGPGRYYVVVCADAKRRVRESREGNNCRPSRTRVQVIGQATSQPDPTSEPGTFPRTPDPIDVEHTVDDGSARTAKLQTWGGSLTTTGADGTAYRLEVPPDALLSPVEITLTPVTSVSGAPLAGGVHAVEILPHGLALMKEATLTITPPAGTDLTRRTGFLFDADGIDFHAYPASFTTDTATMHLTHFSTPGIGQPVAGDVAPGAGRWPRRSQAQLEAAAAELLAQERRNALDGLPGDPDLGDKLDRLMEQWEVDVVQPLLQAGTACGSMETAREGITSALGLARSKILIGSAAEEDALSPTTVALLERVWQAQADCLRVACIEEHRLGAGNMLLGFVRQHQLLGNHDEAERILPWVDQCLRFEVVLESTYAREHHWLDGAYAGSGGRFYYTYDESQLLRGGTRIRTGLDEFFRVSGSGTTSLDEFRYAAEAVNTEGEGEQFTGSGTGWDGGVSSARMAPDLNMYLPTWADGWQPPVPFRTNYVTLHLTSTSLATPGSFEDNVTDELTETYSHTDDDGTTTTHTRSDWVSATRALGARVDPTGGAAVSFPFGAADQAGAVFLDRTWSLHRELCQPDVDATCEEDTTLRVRLIHTPQG